MTKKSWVRKPLHQVSTAVLLILIGVLGGYFLFIQIDIGASEEIMSDNIGAGEDINSTREDINSTGGTPKIYNNPPINKEDYINLLGKIDYNESYDLFFVRSMNDSRVNYSKDPIEDVVNFLDKVIFWSDSSLYKVEDYWASPSQSLSRMKGDDEDFALLGLALHNNFHYKNQSCYLLGNEEFTSIFCYTPNYKKYYGELVIESYIFEAIYSDNWWQSAGDVWTSKIVLKPDDGYNENLVRSEIRIFISDFMEDSVGYCCTRYYKNDVGLNRENRTTLKFLYNEEEFYELETTKDLENWMYGKVEDKVFGQELVR